MSLYSDYNNWQERLQELLAEGEKLGRRIEEMETAVNTMQHRAVKDSNQSIGVLSGLYDEGFHICAANYGHPREDDCLFCLNFLHHKGKPQ